MHPPTRRQMAWQHVAWWLRMRASGRVRGHTQLLRELVLSRQMRGVRVPQLSVCRCRCCWLRADGFSAGRLAPSAGVVLLLRGAVLVLGCVSCGVPQCKCWGVPACTHEYGFPFLTSWLELCLCNTNGGSCSLVLASKLDMNHRRTATSAHYTNLGFPALVWTHAPSRPAGSLQRQ